MESTVSYSRGDAEEERLSEFIDINDEKYTLVKIPHHGRINALSEEFIKISESIIFCNNMLRRRFSR